MVGTIASVATLVLFVLYFIGKGIAIRIGSKLIYEPLEVYYNDKNIPENFHIVDVYDMNGPEALILTSTRGLNSIRCYDCKWSSKHNRPIERTENFKHGFLNVGCSIQINTHLAEGQPEHMIKYTTCDYLEGCFLLQDNLKNGILQENIQLKHTWKSFLYYLVK